MTYTQRPSWLNNAPTKLDIIFFDIETTGGNPSNSCIIEIGAIKFSNGEEVGRLETLVKPNRPVPPIVQKITGIKNAMLKTAPKIEDIFEDFMLFVGDAILVSHGASADVAFLAHYSKKLLNKSFNNYYLCTHLLVSRFLSDLTSKKLAAVAEYFDYEVKYAHTALDDAVITEHIFWRLYKIASEQGFKSCEDLIKLQGDQQSLKKLGIGFDANLLNSAPSMSGLLYILGSEQEITYLSASPNLRKTLSNIIEWSQENKDFQKILVDASGFKIERTANFLDALIREKNELKKLSLPIDPRAIQKRSENFVQILIPSDLLKYAKKNNRKSLFSSSESHNYTIENKDLSCFSDEHVEITHDTPTSPIQETKKTLQFINTLKYRVNRKKTTNNSRKSSLITSHSKYVRIGYLKEGIGYAFGPFLTLDTISTFLNDLLKKYPFEIQNLPMPTRYSHLLTIVKKLNQFETEVRKLKSGLCIISNNAFKELEIYMVVKSRICKKVRLKFEQGEKLKSSRYFTRLFADYYHDIKNQMQLTVFNTDACDDIELFSYWLSEKQGEGEWVDFTELEALYDKTLLA